MTVYLRTFRNATVPFLRFQFGCDRTRKARFPVYSSREPHKVVEEYESSVDVTEFRLLAFGATHCDAERRLRKCAIS